jgi:hypothetical protein
MEGGLSWGSNFKISLFYFLEITGVIFLEHVSKAPNVCQVEPVETLGFVYNYPFRQAQCDSFYFILAYETT